MVKKVEIDVEVKDGGSLSRITKATSKLGAGFKRIGDKVKAFGSKSFDTKGINSFQKSIKTTDRTIKGVGQASSGATKNFSKMSQGITGGLVPAYATLAANVFAISAAFQFFKNAADVSILMEAQKSYSESTGVGLSRITQGLKEASGGMLTYRKAAEAAAIGMAKGFAPSQLEDLAIGARKVAAALGRDFGDAFDRLIRGTSKAEPELLDELGITLRLKDATEDYAAAIKKNVKELTVYERSQAVLLETQRQLDSQFGNVNTKANAFQVLSTTFNQFVQDITQKLLPAFEGFANIVSGSLISAVIVFGALGLSILKAAIPLDTMRENFTKMRKEQDHGMANIIENQKRFRKEMKLSIDVQERLRRSAKAKNVALAGRINERSGGKSKTLAKVANGIELTNADKAILRKSLKDAESQHRRHGKIIRGIHANTSIEVARNFTKATLNMTKDLTNFQVTYKTAMHKMVTGAKLAFTTIRGYGVTAFTAIAKSVGKVGKAMGKLVSLLSGVGIAVLFFEIFMSIKDNLGNIVRSITEFIDDIAGTSFTASFDNSSLGQMTRDMAASADATKRLKDQIESTKKSIESFDSVSALKGLNIEGQDEGVRTRKKAAIVATGSFDKTAKNIKELMVTSPEEGAKALAAFKTKLGPLMKQIPKLRQAMMALELDEISTDELFDNITKSANAAQGNATAFGESLLTVKETMRGATNTSGLLKLEFAVKAASKAAKDADKSMKEFGNGVTNLKTLTDRLGMSVEAYVEALEKLKERREANKDTELELNKLAIKANKLGAVTAAREKTLIGLRKKQLDLSNAILALDNEKRTNTAISAEEKDLRDARIRGLERTVELKREDLTVSTALATNAGRLGKTFKDSFQTGTEGFLSSLIKNEEGSLREGLLNLSKNILTSLADTLSKQLTEMIFKIDSPADKMTNAIIEGARAGAKMFKEAIHGDSTAGGKDSDIKTIAKSSDSGDGQGLFASIFGGGKKGQTRIEEDGLSSGAATAGRTGIFGPVIDSFETLFSADAPFIEKLGGLFSGFGDSFMNIFDSLFGGGSGAGGAGGGILSFIGKLFANGGVATGGFKAFANGGAVTKPTLGMVGEGKFNEAVVPLPDGKSIPVIGMGGGGTNNVAVNIQMDGNGGSKTTATGPDQMKQLGDMLGGLVQQELIKQSRQGGLLNR